ncbi:MAG: pyridoxamine 5'-phosphate oxidase family protein [Planctomycetota bacterium]|nr:pyridoxamine 5'-phosphate oxidase family protein [Planctomycetota bacterium]
MEKNLQKSAEHIRKHRDVHMATVGLDNNPNCRVMYTARIDDENNLWFATHAESDKMAELARNPTCVITSWADHEYVHLTGEVQRVDDPKKKEELWEDEWNMYFPRGKDDPAYALVKVNVRNAEFTAMPKS